MKNIYQEIINKSGDKIPLVLATVTATKGSTPQKSGASALFGLDGRLTGTVGGGFIERSTEKLVANALKNRESGYFHFDLENELEIQNVAAVSNYVSILIDHDPVKHVEVFEKMEKSMSERKAGILLTLIEKPLDEKIRINKQWQENPGTEHQDNSDSELVLAEKIRPLPQLLIVGAGHVGSALCRLCSRLDFEITVIDDRPEYANSTMLPGADQILAGDIVDIIGGLELRNDTYVIISGRSHPEDARALEACINSDAAFVGMIGSKKKIGLMKEKFLSENITTPEAWNAVHTPVGIDINAKTVEEIAVSIAAQLILHRNNL